MNYTDDTDQITIGPTVMKKLKQVLGLDESTNELDILEAVILLKEKVPTHGLSGLSGLYYD